MSYAPEKRNAKWLAWALQRVKSVPYKPTARWLFYRCVQELGFKKKDYRRVFLPTISKARKCYYGGWAPDTLADDTREILNELGRGYVSPKAWMESQAHKSPLLEIGHHQKELVVVCFEAKAMVGQFRHMLDRYRVPLCAFGGDASIPIKYRLSEMLDGLESKWPDKTIWVLYFGDWDLKGREIPINAMKDIEAWCNKPVGYPDDDSEYEGAINFLRCGINEDHIEKYDISENPDAPGKYQWEALDENAAKEIVMDAVRRHWNLDKVRAIAKAEAKCAEIWARAATPVIPGAVRASKRVLSSLGLDTLEDK